MWQPSFAILGANLEIWWKLKSPISKSALVQIPGKFESFHWGQFQSLLDPLPTLLQLFKERNHNLQGKSPLTKLQALNRVRPSGTTPVLYQSEQTTYWQNKMREKHDTSRQKYAAQRNPGDCCLWISRLTLACRLSQEPQIWGVILANQKEGVVGLSHQRWNAFSSHH